MAEKLPDGSYQNYFGYCDKCGQQIETNIQGNEIGSHDCIPIKIPEQIGLYPFGETLSTVN